jgi:hypothetical protein
MVRIERDKSRNLLSTFVSDKFTEEDYEKVMQALQQSVNEWYGLRWYFELRDFSGWEAKANLQYLKIHIEHAEEIAKVAMIGTPKWQDWLTGAMKAFSRAELRYFKPQEKDEAKQWLLS